MPLWYAQGLSLNPTEHQKCVSSLRTLTFICALPKMYQLDQGEPRFPQHFGGLVLSTLGIKIIICEVMVRCKCENVYKTLNTC